MPSSCECHEGAVERNQLVRAVRPPRQAERLAGSSGAEQGDAHQAEIVDVFDHANAVADLFRGHGRTLHFFGLRHPQLFGHIILGELQFACQTHD